MDLSDHLLKLPAPVAIATSFGSVYHRNRIVNEETTSSFHASGAKTSKSKRDVERMSPVYD